MTLKININEQYVSAFMAYLKTLKYASNVEIIQEKTQKESTAEGFRRAAQDSEMFELAESGLDDFLKSARRNYLGSHQLHEWILPNLYYRSLKCFKNRKKFV